MAINYDPYNFTQLQLGYDPDQLVHAHLIGWQVLILLMLIIAFCQLTQLGISIFKLTRR